LAKAVRTHKKRFRWAAVLALLAVAVTAALAGSSFGAELVTAEVTGTANDVTVTQGTSINSTIDVSATGSIACTTTSSNPSTATVDTQYSLSSSGALTSGTPSSAMNFYSNGTASGGSGNCGVTWSGGPTPYSVTASFSAAATTPVGSYTVSLSAAAGTTDETNPNVTGGKLGDATATTITVHVVAPVVTNTAPTVKTAAADANGNEGDTLTTSGAFQDADGDSLSIGETSGAGSLVDNGDGTWSWSLATTDQTSGSVTVQADDGHGHTVSDSFNYSAVNVAPTVSITGAPSTSPEGTQISLGSTVTDPSSADTTAGFTYAWSVTKNGSAYASGTSSTFSFTPDDNGSYVVSLSATDKDGATGNAIDATISVTNVAPTGTFVSPTADLNEGSSFNLAITGASDPSTADTAAGFQYAFDCGAGYGSFGTSNSVTCNTATDGPATLSVAAKVEDKDGGVTEYTGSVTVDNVAPTGTFNAPSAHVNEGSSFNLSITGVTDPSTADTNAGFQYAFDCGDGNGYSTFSSTSSASCPTVDGPATLNVGGKVEDKDGGVSTYTGTVTVDNVAPIVGTLTLGGATGTACGSGNNVTLDFGFTDPGVNDNLWAVDINWGDGDTHTTYNTATQGAQPQQSHSYSVGSFTITVSVTDKDGGTGSNSSASNAVSHLYAMSGILPPFNSDGSSVFKYGSTIPVKVQILDCTGAPVSGLAPQIGTQLKSSQDPAGSVDEVSSTSAADTGTTLRYDPTAGQYIYNLASKSLSDGSATYFVYVRESHSIGKTNTGAASVGQSYQQFALKLK
jgi:Cadherin-like domain